MLTSHHNTLDVTKTVSPLTQAKQIEDTRRKEVQLILENLFEREEDTVKLVIDCLFDMGAVYLINRKIPTPIVNPFVKQVAKVSKSGIRILAFRYVMKKFVMSGVLTNFLFNKVKGLVGANQWAKKQKELPVPAKSLQSETPLPQEQVVVNDQEKKIGSSSQQPFSVLPSSTQLTPESQKVLNYHIEAMAKVIYQETNCRQEISLAQIEDIIRQQTFQSMAKTVALSQTQLNKNDGNH